MCARREGREREAGHAGRSPNRGQEQRVPRSAHAGGSRGRNGQGTPGATSEGGRRGQCLSRRRVRGRWSRDGRERRGGVGRVRADPEGEGTDRLRVPADASQPGAVHLSASGGESATDRGPGGVGHHGDRLRDRSECRWRATPPCPHERDCRTALGPGGSSSPHAFGRRQGSAARGRSGYAQGAGGGDRWRSRGGARGCDGPWARCRRHHP